ncbi:MAG: oligosaccharide flippase family protein [Chloroflexota bacterium]|nr:oligosaccharide flippase family protein [Chloroflexota bacterium]
MGGGDERAADAGPIDDRARAETRMQIRGSGLLMVGRVTALATNFVTQVIIVRYLSMAAYGAFAYGIALVALIQVLLGLGLDRAVPRYLPLYEERRDHAALFGTLTLVAGTIAALGFATIGIVYALQSWLAGSVVNDPTAVSVLLILIFLAPIESFDSYLTNVLAVFGATRAIFLRRYVVTPVLRLGVATLLVLGSLDVGFLAIGYVVTGVLGLALFGTLLPGILRRRRLLDRLPLRGMRFHVRELVGYGLPVLSTDLLIGLMLAFDAVLLTYSYGTEELAALQAVEPAARTNMLVMASFSLLFVPVATRFFARFQHDAVNDLYWQTTAWMAVLGFPIFALTFGLAEPLTEFLYGERYRDSWTFLALLALGRYVDAAFGANGLTLRVYGKVKELVSINVVAAILHVVVAMLLIPPVGALGAAVAVAVTFIVYNVIKQLAIGRYTPVKPVNRRYAGVYVVIAGAALLFVAQWLMAPPLVVAVATTALLALIVFAVGRRVLHINEMFPELLRVPGARFLLGG